MAVGLPSKMQNFRKSHKYMWDNRTGSGLYIICKAMSTALYLERFASLCLCIAEAFCNSARLRRA
jgi:hypothetical protein